MEVESVKDLKKKYNTDEHPEKILRWWNVVYILDYAMIFFCIILVIIAEVGIEPSKRFQETFRRLSDYEKLQYNYPIVSETWPTYALVIVVVIVPNFGFFAAQVWIKSLLDLHNAILGWLYCVGTTYWFTFLMKKLFGSLRPNFIAIAYERSDDLASGRDSFPSAHASLAAASFGFVSLYLYGKMRFYSKDKDFFLYKFLIVAFPMLLGLYISASRVPDHQHYISDVIAGFLLGLFFAVNIYYLYFFPSWHSHFPGEPRVKVTQSVGDVFLGDTFSCLKKNKDKEDEDGNENNEEDL